MRYVGGLSRVGDGSCAYISDSNILWWYTSPAGGNYTSQKDELDKLSSHPPHYPVFNWTSIDSSSGSSPSRCLNQFTPLDNILCKITAILCYINVVTAVPVPFWLSDDWKDVLTTASAVLPRNENAQSILTILQLINMTKHQFWRKINGKKKNTMDASL